MITALGANRDDFTIMSVCVCVVMHMSEHSTLGFEKSLKVEILSSSGSELWTFQVLSGHCLAVRLTAVGFV